MLSATFGITQLPSATLHYVTADVTAYLAGFSVVFHNFTENKTVTTLSLGENIIKIAQLQFFNNGCTLLSTEIRPEGACVSIYEKNSAFQFQFKHRIFIAVKTNQGMKIVKSIILAHFVTENRLLVITDFTSGYQMLIYDNDQKTTSLPTYSLKITQPDIIDSKNDQEIETLKIVQLTDKELLFIANSTIKFIKLAAGTAKVLAPNNMQSLTGNKIFTDGIYLNKALLKKYPFFPQESDKLILLSTKDGSICVIFNNTIVSEFKCEIVKEFQFNQMLFLNDPVVFLNGFDGKNTFEDVNPARTNFTFFNSQLNQIDVPERSAGFLAVASSKGLVHFYGIQISEFFRFVVKNVYSGSTNWEKQFDSNKFFVHLLSYSCAGVVDSLLCRTNPPFDVQNLILTKNERFMVGYGRNQSQKMIFGLKLPLLVKRIMEVDGLRGQFILQSRDLNTLKDVIRTMLTNQTEEVKKLISQDQLTIIKGEVTDLNSMDAEILQINFQSSPEDSLDQSLPYDYNRNTELWLVKPLFTNNTITSTSSSIISNNLAILSNDRIVRIFDQFTLNEFSLCRFPDTASQILLHPSAQYLVLAGTDFIMLCQIYLDRILKLHQFNIQFCKVMAFSHSGDLFLAASGIHLHVFDFYAREELYKIDDFPSRVSSIQPIFRDFSSGKYEGLFWISCADGTVCIFDAASGKREKQCALRGMHVLVSCCIGVGGIISQKEGQLTINQFLPQNPLLFGIMTDATIRVFDFNAKERGILNVNLGNDQVIGVGNALNLIEIRGSASNDVICSINDGKWDQKKVYKGRPTMLLQMLNYLIISYEQGYVIVKNIKNLIEEVAIQGNQGDITKFLSRDKESEEIVIPINNTRITGLSAIHDNTGFIVSTEDGLVYSIKFKNFMTPKPLVQQQASISQTQEKTSVLTANFLPFSVHDTQLQGIYKTINHAKNYIFDTKKELQQKLQFLDDQFQIDLNKIINSTNDNISTHLSEHARLKTDHDNKAILLKRQIANNENLFKDSKRALENQYQKRLVMMQEQISELQTRQINVEEDLIQKQQVFVNETSQQVDDYMQQRESELDQLTNKTSALNKQLSFMTEQNELIYKLSEDQLYVECDNYSSFYNQRNKELDLEQEQVKQLNYTTKQEYRTLETSLINQKKLLSAKEIEISDLKSKIAELRKAINDNKNEIRNRDSTISQREKRVVELNQKIRELNKISFILQFKIRELKRTIQPKDQERADLKIKLKEMNQELSQYRLNLMQLQTNKKELTRKITALKQQITISEEEKYTILHKLSEVRVSVNRMKRVLDSQIIQQKSLNSLPNLQLQNSKMQIQPSAIGIDKNMQYKQLVNEIKNIDMTLTQKANKLVEQREQDEVNGNFSKMEANVVKLQQKVSAQNNQTKSSTSGVMQQNALLLQEINQLRRELHQAQVQANSDCKIDEALLDRYEENRSEILRLRNVIRAKERQAKVGGAFLPDLQ
ncbi:WD40 repeat protein [Spironucleus salmonicida]|uniref:WD40 and SMC domain-containing protein n=1 Tax=Spironucleus salmonicida TaxID=348837 RepID=V6LQX5_9EUKA|nr:WD40 repeat protein [Spironucleus salmonicida]|eukprot:EST46990.1 WD40 and SMC domain-containing protein [Spironucleus salmonicida]